MKTVHIKATAFFEFLKSRDTSMWEIFEHMIDGTEKEIVFLDDENRVLFTYLLPKSPEILNSDREKFAEEYTRKLSGLN